MQRHAERVPTNHGNGIVPESEDPSTRALVSEIGGRLIQLAQTEVELARAELASDVGAGRRTIIGLGVAVVAGLAGFTLLLVAVTLALVPLLPGWLAALVVAVVVLGTSVTVGGLAWRQRPRSPLALTRKSLTEDWEWLKEQVA
jgi:uncharacterized membrane protein YqjE